jgi:cysteine-rich repeat protein
MGTNVCQTFTPTPTITNTPANTPTVTPTATSACGNGVLDAGVGEQCDDSNRANGDGCPALPVVLPSQTPAPPNTADDCKYSNSGQLIRGSRRDPKKAGNRSCQLEWYVVQATALLDKKYQLPSSEQRCTDGNPTCDFAQTDGSELTPAPVPDGVCGFKVVLCMNNEDRNLPACKSPAGVASVVSVGQLSNQHSAAAQSLVDKDRLRLQVNLGELLNPMMPCPTPVAQCKGQYVFHPPLTQDQRNFCSKPFNIDVPLDGRSRRKLKLRVVTADASRHAVHSASKLQLVCEAPASK